MAAYHTENYGTVIPQQQQIRTYSYLLRHVVDDTTPSRDCIAPTTDRGMHGDRTQCAPNPITNFMRSNPMTPRPSRRAPFSVSPTPIRQLRHGDRGNARKTSDLPPLNGPQELNSRPPDMMRPGLASSTNMALAGGLSANSGPYSAGKSFQPQIWPGQRRHRSQG